MYYLSGFIVCNISFRVICTTPKFNALCKKSFHKKSGGNENLLYFHHCKQCITEITVKPNKWDRIKNVVDLSMSFSFGVTNFIKTSTY